MVLVNVLAFYYLRSDSFTFVLFFICFRKLAHLLTYYKYRYFLITSSAFWVVTN